MKTKERKEKRESPQDFWQNFLRWKKENPDRNVACKAYAIIREEKKVKGNKK